jgi:hypothetical protein
MGPIHFPSMPSKVIDSRVHLPTMKNFPISTALSRAMEKVLTRKWREKNRGDFLSRKWRKKSRRIFVAKMSRKNRGDFFVAKMSGKNRDDFFVAKMAGKNCDEFLSQKWREKTTTIFCRKNGGKKSRRFGLSIFLPLNT